MLRRIVVSNARTFVDIRRAYTKTYQVKDVTAIEVILWQFRIVHFTKENFAVKLRRPICRWIDRLVDESKL
jgi:hypothetical protein